MRSIGVATRQYKPNFNMTLTDGNNNTYSITNGDVQSDSLAIRTGTSNSGELTLGAAVIGSLSVVLLNDDKNSNKYDNVAWRGAHIEAAFTVNGASVSLGTFYVNEHSEQGGTIRVVAYDSMQVLDGYKIYEHNFTYPLDAVTAVNTIAAARGLHVSGLTGVSLSLPDPGTDQMSERAFLSYVAQILCKYVVIKRLNGYDTIFFGWYDTAHPVANAGTTFSHDLATSDYNPENFQIKVYDTSYTVTVRGTGGTGPLTNAVYIENNPFIRASNVGDPSPGGGMAYDIYTQVHALTYRPGSADIVSDIALEAGDVITVSTGPLGGTYTMIITNLTFGTGLTMSISSDADPSDDMIFNPSTYFKKATQQAISDELADADSELSKAIGGGGGGDGDECEWIKLDGCYIWMKASSSSSHTYEKFNGVTLELVKQDNYHSDVTQMVSRVPGNTTQLSGFNSEDGIDIVKVQYPTQWIKVPVNDQDIRWIDLWVGDVTQPTLNEYKVTYGNSFTEAVRQARRCNFECYSTRPGRVRIKVKRFKDDTNSFSKDFIVFGDDNYYYEPYRPKALYNGLQLLTTEYINYAPKGRIPYVEFYFPGQVYDMDEDNTSTYHKWCYIHRDSMGSPSVLELIPPYYFTTSA